MKTRSASNLCHLRKEISLYFSGENHFSGSRIDSSKLGADPGMPVEISSEVGEATKVENNRSPTYRCKKCRRVVALHEHVVDHIPGEGETSFGWHKRRSGNPFNKSNESECSSIFIEPLRWMKAGKKTPNYNIKMSLFFQQALTLHCTFVQNVPIILCKRLKVVFYNIFKCILLIFSCLSLLSITGWLFLTTSFE